MGWEIVGNFPNIKKYIVAVAPHTSWVDFLIGIFTRKITNEDIKFAAKDSFFKPPFGGIFRKIGGYPVYRTEKRNFVQSIVDIFNKEQEFRLAIAPEGTRKRVERFKTGFYYIAKSAKVPIVLVGFDFTKRQVFIDETLFLPTNNAEADLAYLWNYFKVFIGKKPERGVF